MSEEIIRAIQREARSKIRIKKILSKIIDRLHRINTTLEALPEDIDEIDVIIWEVNKAIDSLNLLLEEMEDEE